MNSTIARKLTAHITNTMDELPCGIAYVGQLLNTGDLKDEYELSGVANALLWVSRDERGDIDSATEFLSLVEEFASSIVDRDTLDKLYETRQDICTAVDTLGFRFTRVKELNELGTMLVRSDDNQPIAQSDLIKARFSAVYELEDLNDLALIKHVVAVENFLNHAIPLCDNIIALKQGDRVSNIHIISPINELAKFYDYYLELCDAEKSA